MVKSISADTLVSVSDVMGIMLVINLVSKIAGL